MQENCKEENCVEMTQKLFEMAKNEYNAYPQFAIQLIVLSGILQWNYQIQILIS